MRGKAGGKVIRENEPVLLVLSVCDGEIILEKGEILCEKCQLVFVIILCYSIRSKRDSAIVSYHADSLPEPASKSYTKKAHSKFV